jgi:hypothetical protein
LLVDLFMPNKPKCLSGSVCATFVSGVPSIRAVLAIRLPACDSSSPNPSRNSYFIRSHLPCFLAIDTCSLTQRPAESLEPQKVAPFTSISFKIRCQQRSFRSNVHFNPLLVFGDIKEEPQVEKSWVLTSVDSSSRRIPSMLIPAALSTSRC